jgi:hypothetical protein
MMQKILMLKLALVLSLFSNAQYLSGQENDSMARNSIYQDLSNHQTNRVAKNSEYRNSLEIGPDYDIYFIQFCRKFSSRDEIVLGLSYLNSSIGNFLGYPGDEQLYALELGYRKYLCKNLHLEFQILPQYVTCYDNIIQKSYDRFGLASEIRLGYLFDFDIFDIPFYINLQWFCGYYLYNPKPQSFVEVDGGPFYISPVPMFLIGIKF